ncbi:hypothetical protein ACIQXU_04195 [Peribacillus sp. NPDC097284]|uniref:BclA C-terminal domain-containing protein n=1 Tax=Peribacillus sp. NPDC097284 TaxID=3364401 RepID=UPI003814CFE0
MAAGTDVTFDTNGTITPGITHTAGSPDITVTTPGTYEVTFSVTPQQTSQFGLTLNGALVPGSVYGSGSGSQEITGQALVTLADGDVLTLRNVTNSSITLPTGTGGAAGTLLLFLKSWMQLLNTLYELPIFYDGEFFIETHLSTCDKQYLFTIFQYPI